MSVYLGGSFLLHALPPVPVLLSLLFSLLDCLDGLLDPYHLLRHIKGSHSCITHLFRIPPASLAYDGSSSDTRCVWAAAARLTATPVSARAADSTRVTHTSLPPVICRVYSSPSYCVQRRNTRARRSSWATFSRPGQGTITSFKLFLLKSLLEHRSVSCRRYACPHISRQRLGFLPAQWPSLWRPVSIFQIQPPASNLHPHGCNRSLVPPPEARAASLLSAAPWALYQRQFLPATRICLLDLV